MDCVGSQFGFLQEADRPYVHTEFLLGPSYVQGCNVNDGETEVFCDRYSITVSPTYRCVSRKNKRRVSGYQIGKPSITEHQATEHSWGLSFSLSD